MKMHVFHKLIISILCYCLSVSLTWGATYTVTTTTESPYDGCDVSHCTLREAIIDANNNPNSDTILLVSGSTYQLNLIGASEDNSANGDLDIRDDLIIDITGGTDNAIIDATNLNDRVFDIQGTISPFKILNITLNNITIANGIAPTGQNGGGINNLYSNLTLNDVNIIDNTATNGGGIYIAFISSGNFGNCLISGNTVNDGDGGGIFAIANVSLTSSIISDNHATGTSQPSGGGISAYNTPVAITLTDSIVMGNSAVSFGGGISVQDSATLSLDRSTVYANTSDGDSGGIFAFNQATITTVNSTISNNQAPNSGGIGTQSAGNIKLYNTTISNNIATNFSGGITLSGTPLLLKNSVIANNSGNSFDCYKTGGSSIITQDGANWIENQGNCGLTGSSVLTLGQDPQLSVLSDNGGFVPTHLPAESSGLVNAVPQGECSDNNEVTLTVDARGMTRDENINLCDIGAVEIELPLFADGFEDP